MPIDETIELHVASSRSNDHATIDVPEDAETSPRILGDFQIVRELGRGGMGVVFEAMQLSLGRRVALKVLSKAGALDEVRVQRFRNEATAVAQLHHPNIVPVYAVGSDAGVHFFAMQLVTGNTLAWLIETVRADTNVLTQPKRRNDYFRRVVQMVIQSASAIEHAHVYGVVHRDIKPANLMIDNEDRLWVTDFGVAQMQQADSRLTGSGHAPGTLRYMSPEQAAGDGAVLDHRTDIYSLGVTLYELLMLTPAIDGIGYHDLLEKVIHHEPVSPKQLMPSLPTDLDTIVRKATAKSATERYATAQELADDLQRWLDDVPIVAQPPTPLQRFAKWRRRHRVLVHIAISLLLVGSILLSATTAYVMREHSRTKVALANERHQRRVADDNFSDARRAVDTFSRLSELQLAHHPELIGLRRTFLETTLEFYNGFVSRQMHDALASADLEEVSQRVSRMANELAELNTSVKFLMLANNEVRRELGIDDDQATQLQTAIREIKAAHQSFGERLAKMDDAEVEAMEQRIAELVATVSKQLNASQLEQLEVISTSAVKTDPRLQN